MTQDLLIPAATGSRDCSISAVVYSRNEASLLRPCLAQLDGFDEIIVCDMQSTDETRAVSHSHGARVVSVPDARVVEAVRQLGLEAATSAWVIFVDADELLPDGFAPRLRELISGRPDVVAWLLGYTNVAFGRTLRHVLQGSAKYALVRVDKTHYPAVGRAHVPPSFYGPTADATTEIPSILHLNFRDPAQTVEKVLRYAPDIYAPVSLLTPFGFIRETVRKLVFSGAWRDGFPGLAVATSQLFGDWYAALLEAERREVLRDEVPDTQRRLLDIAASLAIKVVAARDGLRRLGGRATRSGR